jgi:D-3-phosphoglycerate dehydrogenase
MAGFGTTLIAYDPYVQPARAAQLGVRLVSLEELLRESDFISIHLPKTPETVGLIGERELRCASRPCASSTPRGAGCSTSRRWRRR